MADALPISGQVDPKGFPYLLTDLHRQGATGSLKVDGPSYQKALYYRGGRVLFGSSNDPRDQLGAILIEEGRITPDQLEDVNAKVGPGNPLAKVLADSGYVSQRELSAAAKTKVERILSDVIAYESGGFEFEDGVLPKGAVDLKLSTPRLVLAAVRRLGDRSFVLRHLGNLETVLAAVPADTSEVQEDAGTLLAQLDGTCSLKQAAAAAGLEEFEAGKLACALLFLGLIEKQEGVDLAAEAEAAFHPDATLLMASPQEDLGLDEAQTLADTPALADADSTMLLPGADEEPAFVLPDAGVEPAVEPQAEPEPEPEADSTIVLPPPPEPVPARPAARAELPLIPPPPRARPAPPAEMPDIPAPPAPAARPSRQDLAALDALLNAKPAEGPLAPLEKATPTRAWEPQLGRPEPRGRDVRPMLFGAVAVAVLAGGAGWYFLAGPGAAPPKKLAQAPVARTPGPAAPATTPAVPATPTPALTPSPTASVPPSGAPTTPAAPPATPTAAPASVPPATQRPAPPTAAPPATTPARPGAGAPPPAAASPLAEARGLMQKGQFGPAARAFATHVRSAKGYSLQLLVACSEDTVQKAVSSATAPELFVVPVDLKGRSCYRLCWGLYDSEARAQTAARAVPSYFTSGGARPRVVTTAQLLE